MRTSEANDLASNCCSVNQSRSAATSALSKVCNREANSDFVVPSTRLRTQMPTRLRMTAPIKGQTHRCLESTNGARMMNRANALPVEPFSPRVTIQDCVHRLCLSTVLQGRFENSQQPPALRPVLRSAPGEGGSA